MGLQLAQTPPRSRSQAVVMNTQRPNPPPVPDGSIEGATSCVVARCYQFGCWFVIELGGELDLMTVPVVAAVLEDHPRHIVFDLTGLDFIDARGVGLLADTRARLGPAHGSVRVAGPTPQARKLLALTAIDQQVGVYDSIGASLGGHVSCW